MINGSFALFGTLLWSLFGLGHVAVIPNLPEISRPPNAFSSDGCSGAPDLNVRQCCVVHDVAYWCGGTRKQRVVADLQFKRCITNLGRPDLAKIYFLGVRAGGTPHLPTRWRWGFGWPFPNGYSDDPMICYSGQ